MNDTPARQSARSDRPAANEDDVIVLDSSELPAYCPNPSMPIWSSHPRVFLDVSRGEQARCPYCGTRYRLQAGAVPRGRH